MSLEQYVAFHDLLAVLYSLGVYDKRTKMRVHTELIFKSIDDVYSHVFIE